MRKPFEGVRVMDFTQVLAGPYATFQLACLGADVIKLEEPRNGDQARQLITPTPASREAGHSALSTAVNGGKRSLTLDLKHPQARQVVDRLVAHCDVLVENYKAGQMERLGLGYERVQPINPSLIYCSISGYGQSGPRADAAAYDPVIQAASGMMSVTGFEDTGPTKAGFWICDMSTGMNAAFAISSALYRRTHTGQGEYIDVSMLDTAVSLMSPLLSLNMNFGVVPPMTGNGAPGTGGSSTVYPTQQGFITIAAVTEAQFAALVTEAGRADMVDDPRFNSRESRVINADAYRAAMVDALSSDTADGWERRLSRLKVPASKNLTIPELREDPQLNHRQMFKPLRAPTGLESAFEQSPFTVTGLGFKLARDGPDVTTPPPAKGEHSQEILTELGFAEADITALRESGAV